MSYHDAKPEEKDIYSTINHLNPHWHSGGNFLFGFPCGFSRGQISNGAPETCDVSIKYFHDTEEIKVEH